MNPKLAMEMSYADIKNISDYEKRKTERKLDRSKRLSLLLKNISMDRQSYYIDRNFKILIVGMITGHAKVRYRKHQTEEAATPDYKFCGA